MLKYFEPGDLVRADRPDFIIPATEARKVGLIIGHLPPGHGHSLAVTQLLVAWTGPLASRFLTIEPDHRVAHI